MEFPDRPQGWTLLQALSELQVEVFRMVFASSAKTGFQQEHGRTVAWEGIVSQLEQGQLHATGIAPPGKAPEAIDPAFAAAAIPDFDANTLTLGGSTFSAVRIWCGPVRQAVPVLITAPHGVKKVYTPEALRSWFRLRTYSWPQNNPPPTEAHCRAAAESEFSGLPSRAVFRELRAGATPENWRKQGRRKAP